MVPSWLYKTPVKKRFKLLTAVLLVAVIRAVIIIITSPWSRDTSAVPALKLTAFTVWFSSCHIKKLCVNTGCQFWGRSSY